MRKAGRIVTIAVLVAQALVLSLAESWIPVPVPVPGIKLGLANVITIVSLALLGLKDTVIIVVLRTLLGAVFAGSPMVFAFSLSGGIASTFVMAVLMYRFSSVFSMPGISVAGAVAHNTAQIFTACAVMASTSVFAYLPLLLLTAVITGICVGFVAKYAVGRLEKSSLIKHM